MLRGGDDVEEETSGCERRTSEAASRRESVSARSGGGETLQFATRPEGELLKVLGDRGGAATRAVRQVGLEGGDRNRTATIDCCIDFFQVSVCALARKRC